MRLGLAMVYLGCAALPGLAHFGVPLNAPSYDPAFAYGKSFLDPSRLHMSQSVSFGFSTSSLGRQSGGLYLNQITYDLSSKLRLQVDMGMSQIFQSSSPQYMPAEQSPKFVLPHIGLEYKPTKNLSIGVHYFELDGSNMYGSPFSRWPAW